MFNGNQSYHSFSFFHTFSPQHCTKNSLSIAVALTYKFGLQRVLFSVNIWKLCQLHVFFFLLFHLNFRLLEKTKKKKIKVNLFYLLFNIIDKNHI